MSKVTFLLCMTLAYFLSACSPKKTIKKLTITHRYPITSEYSCKQAPSINIWIHGTRFIRRPLFHSFFNSTPSLRLAKELATDYYLRKVVNTLNTINPSQFSLDTFYLFGWSGKLRSTIHEEAAKILSQELQRIIHQYEQKYHQKPFIRLITHSHGGTVALNLGKVKETEGQKFTINELILLACPVQESTCKYIEDILFERTISLYSSLDMVQVLAPQVIYNVFRTKRGHVRSRMHWPPFSYRRFQEHPKLAQVKVKINGRALFHTEFTSHHFISILPHIIHVMNNWGNNQSIIPHSTNLLCVYTRNLDPTEKKESHVPVS